ncbi:hypothetical protein WN944_015694 [Citrus x changshan-huyou]|uniref:Polygalacturonase n=1 Tax=Citrus x changshan-huyou TaxID=2935761 RepID=A0AAP0QM13_9ROSI
MYVLLQSIGFSNSNNIAINGLTSLNSQMYHIVFNGCNNVKLQGVKVLASGNSPSTDGIHFQLSSGVTILNTRISTGDDSLLALEPTIYGSKMLHVVLAMESVKNCDIYRHSKWAKNKVMGETKQWFCQKNFLFQHAVMKNVQNPIIIDQNYCPDNEGCPGKVRYQKDI